MDDNFFKPFPEDLVSWLKKRENPLPLAPEKATGIVRDDLEKLTEEPLWRQRKKKDLDLANAALSGLWLWFGYLDRAHEICQDIPSSEGSYWHGIMHRIEGDFWNAKYWMRRVGSHPVHAEVRTALGEISEVATFDAGVVKGSFQGNLLLPESFVDQCELAIGGTPEEAHTCRWIQTCEWRSLMLYCLSGL